MKKEIVKEESKINVVTNVETKATTVVKENKNQVNNQNNNYKNNQNNNYKMVKIQIIIAIIKEKIIS